MKHTTQQYLTRPGLVYRVFCTRNGKIYVGVTSQSLAARKSGHKHDAFRCFELMGEVHYPSKLMMYSEMRSFGWNAFVWDVLKECTSMAEAFEYEANLIRDWKPEYNNHCGNYKLSANGVIPARHLHRPKEPLAPKKKPVICKTDGLLFESLAAAARHYDVYPNHISDHLRGKTPHVKHRLFQYT